MAAANLFIDASLIHRLRLEGEMEDAARALLSCVGVPLLRYFRSRGGLTVEQAEDVLQDTMLRVIRSADTFRGQTNATPWIWTVGRNAMFEQVRTLARKNEFEANVSEETWEAIQDTLVSPNLCHTGISVDECVDGGIIRFESRMPDRAMVLRLVMDGVEVAELATQLGRSYGATKVYLFECRKKLKPFIEHCLEVLRTEEQNANPL